LRAIVGWLADLSFIRRSVLEEPEACGREIGIECKGRRNLAAFHHQKTDLVHQTDFALGGPFQLTDASSVELFVDPFDDKVS